MFFCRGVLETVKKLGWMPDIIHCHGWMSALMPVYLKSVYENDPHFSNSKVIYSLYEEANKIKFPKNFVEKLAFDEIPTENLNINGLLNYSELKQLETSEYYFSGNIFRLTTRYQFSNFLNLRLIAEKNTFNKSFFIQPLVQWNPNPSTIFYLGGNQNTDLEIDEEIIPLLKFRRSQIFFKFQYLIGLKK